MSSCSYAINTSTGVAYQATPYVTSISVNTPGGKLNASPPVFNPNSDVSFNRISGVTSDNPGTSDTFRPQTFSVQVLNATDVLTPSVYTGSTSSTCMTGLEILPAEDANTVVLSYTPPAPPQILLDVVLPNRPDFSMVKVSLPTSGLSIGPMSVLPEIFTYLESEVETLIHNVLEYLSEDEALDAVEDAYRGASSQQLSLRGITPTAARDFVTRAARDKASFIRSLALLARRSNTTTVAHDLLNDLDAVSGASHAETQITTLEVLKVNSNIALQNISLGVMLYNIEVNQALLDYQEFSKLTRVELNKLEVYNVQLASVSSAIAGNTELLAAYKKQVAVIKQVFESFEDSMKLSEVSLNLATSLIQVETENIKTATMLVDGDTAKARNTALSAENSAKAHGMNIEAEIAKGRVDLLADRTRLESNVLTSDLNIKNNLIDSENSYLQSLADSVSAKLTNVKSLFDQDIIGHTTDATLSFLSSHSRSLDRANQQTGRQATSESTHLSAINSLGIPVESLSARRNAWQRRVSALTTYNANVETAAQTLSTAAQTQALIHTITSN